MAEIYALMEHSERLPIVVEMPDDFTEDDAINWALQNSTEEWEFIKIVNGPAYVVTLNEFHNVIRKEQ